MPIAEEAEAKAAAASEDVLHRKPSAVATDTEEAEDFAEPRPWAVPIKDIPEDVLDEMVSAIVTNLVADAVTAALNEDGRSLRQIENDTGLDKGFLSRMANGKNCTIESIVKLAVALGMTAKLSIE